MCHTYPTERRLGELANEGIVIQNLFLRNFISLERELYLRVAGFPLAKCVLVPYHFM
jgi:hypothetical protein